jgi:hypothetical protein
MTATVGIKAQPLCSLAPKGRAYHRNSHNRVSSHSLIILQIADRWIVQYNLYVNDQRWGRIFVSKSPWANDGILLRPAAR